MADATTHPAETVLAFMRRQGIELESSHIVLALSGGLDSVCLAQLLAELRKSQKFGLSLAHVNHHLRADSDVDEAFCTALAARLQLPLSVTHLDPRSRGQASVEAWARDQRYAALEKVADQLGADWIATAHHADDQVETVLMRLQQGSSLLTLAGIRPVNGRVIRPLLELSRAQIAKWAAERRLRSGPGLLRPGRRPPDGDRRQPDRRPPRWGDLRRRRHDPRSRGRGAGAAP